jgi:hypothetical protein
MDASERFQKDFEREVREESKEKLGAEYGEDSLLFLPEVLGALIICCKGDLRAKLGALFDLFDVDGTINDMGVIVGDTSTDEQKGNKHKAERRQGVKDKWKRAGLKVKMINRFKGYSHEDQEEKEEKKKSTAAGDDYGINTLTKDEVFVLLTTVVAGCTKMQLWDGVKAITRMQDDIGKGESPLTYRDVYAASQRMQARKRAELLPVFLKVLNKRSIFLVEAVFSAADDDNSGAISKVPFYPLPKSSPSFYPVSRSFPSPLTPPLTPPRSSS